MNADIANSERAIENNMEMLDVVESKCDCFLISVMIINYT